VREALAPVAVRRRATPSVPFYFPDWLVLRELSRDVARALDAHARGRLLDVGCGEKPYAGLAGNVAQWVGFDHPSNASADVRGHAESMPFDDASFDTVLCTQVIEHVPEPRAVLAECARVLRPGGTLIVSAPQYWEVHEAPHDYYRFTPIGLEHLIRGCGLEVVSTWREGTGVKVGAQALNLSIQHWGERNSLGSSVLARALKVPLYAFNNLTAMCASIFITSDRDALNLLAIATKP
jgi:SAM-dependent methyltransferase